MALLWFGIGLAGMVYGVFRVMRERERVDSLVIGGGFVDVGFVVAALGTYVDAGHVGMALTLLYQGLARYVACMVLCRLTPKEDQPCLAMLQGLVTSRPRLAVLLCFSLVAALGVSPFMTLEGRNFVLYALACEGGLWLGALVAIPYTILAWRTAKVVLAVCFTPPSGELAANAASDVHPLPAEAKNPACLYIGAALLLVFGLTRGVFVHAFNGLFGGPGLPVLESAWPLAVIIMYVGAFPLLCRKPQFEAWRNVYALILSLAGFIGVLWSDFAPLGFMFALIITGMGVLVVAYSMTYIENTRRKPAYWFFLALTFASLLGIVTANSAGTLATFWEVMTWASFVLIAWEQSAKARAAALKYLVICVGGAYVMIPALFVLNGSAATLVAGGMEHMPGLPPSTLLWALLFALVGFAAKAGLVPVHGWLPDAHPAAPSSVSAPLSGVLTKVGLFGVVLVFFVLAGDGQLSRAGTGYAGLSMPGLVVTTLGLLTMLYGEYKALQQDDIKRLLAYSTMGQVGEIATVLGLGTWLSTTGALAHVFNHAIMKDLLFLCAGALILRTGSRKLPDLAGLAQVMPWTVGCMLVGLVSIMGLPPFNGFISKYLMIIACLDAGYPTLALALLGASLAGAVYYMRVLRVLVFDAPLPHNAVRVASYTDVPWPMRTPLVILAGLCVFFGIVPQAGLALITPVADLLAGQGQFAIGSLPALAVAWPVYVIVPMLGAVLPVLYRADRRKAGRATALVLAVTTLLVPVFGQTLDTLSFGMALIIPAVGALNMVYAVGYMEHSHTQWRFYCFFLLMTGGLLGVAASTDLFSFFTFWEIMSSWALYFAIAHEGTPEAVREAFKYFLFNVAGAACLFLGIGIIVARGGTSNFSEVGAALLGLSGGWGTAVMALMALGFTMKAAQLAVRIDWQMHPDLAPTPVSGYISSVLLKIAVFGMVKLFLEFGGVHLRVPDAADLFNQTLIMNLVAWAGALTLLFAAFKAMCQKRIKMVFIWSTVSQIGYMVLGIALGTSLGLAGGLMHLTCHVFFKDLLFFTAGAVMLQTHQSSIDQLGGIGRRMPVTMGCFALGALTATGMPPTVGFTSKWLIYQALMEQGEVLLALISLVGSVVTLAYLARFVHLVFLGRPTHHTEDITDAPLVMRAAMLVLAAITVLAGVFPGLFLWPVNQVVVEYGLPSLDVALWGLASGPGAWNATLMSVLVFTAFGGTWWGLRRVMRTVPERRLDPHSCGLPPMESVSPQRAESLYAALAAVRKEGGSC